LITADKFKHNKNKENSVFPQWIDIMYISNYI
jgi:hypothetical protein